MLSRLRVEDQRAHDNQVAELRKKVDESLQQTLTNVYMDFDQVVDQVKVLHPGVSLPLSELDLFKTIEDGALVDTCGATSQGDEV